MSEGGASRILELLDETVPPPVRGTRLLEMALALSGLARVPDTTPELRAFVRRSLLPILEEELGPRLAREVTSDLEAALSPALKALATVPVIRSSRRLARVNVESAPPPVSRTVARARGEAVLVVGEERVATAMLARSLIGAGYRVVVAHDADELAAASPGGPLAAPFIAIVTDEPCATEFASALRALVPAGQRAVLVVTGCRSPRETEVFLQGGGVELVLGLASSASSRDLVATLARATAG